MEANQICASIGYVVNGEEYEIVLGSRKSGQVPGTILLASDSKTVEFSKYLYREVGRPEEPFSNESNLCRLLAQYAVVSEGKIKAKESSADYKRTIHLIIGDENTEINTKNAEFVYGDVKVPQSHDEQIEIKRVILYTLKGEGAVILFTTKEQVKYGDGPNKKVFTICNICAHEYGKNIVKEKLPILSSEKEYIAAKWGL